MNVAVVGASADRHKFGNKAVRAYLNQNHTVFPVNLREGVIEGQIAFATVEDIPMDVDVTLVYLPPEKTMTVLEGIARKGTDQLFLNPGSETPEVVEKARELGLDPILACSIIAAGESPSAYTP